MFPHSKPSLWDMRVLLYKLIREIWLETTDGDPIGKMNKFTFFITNVVNKCAHSRTLCSILIFLLPHRMMDVSLDDINWVRDSLLDSWREEGTNIINEWWCHHGFVTAASPLAVLKVMDHQEARDGSRFRLFGKVSMPSSIRI